ncbi:hypothetical protein [Undibacterium sp. TC9W]|uniref:hypothetical protein n=1 Tax=Undibacterium sp. TC9W TaxID=3413053 RepID=UPI003BF0F15D
MHIYFKKILIGFESRVTSQNFFYASFSLFLYAVVPTLLIASSALLLAKFISPSIYATVGTGGGQKNLSLFPTLIFNPFVESLLLASLIFLSIKCRFKTTLTVLLPAILMAAMHAVANPMWGITILWTFITHSNAFRLSFRKGLMRAYYTIVVAHSLQNGSVLLFAYFWEQGRGLG